MTQFLLRNSKMQSKFICDKNEYILSSSQEYFPNPEVTKVYLQTDYPRTPCYQI